MAAPIPEEVREKLKTDEFMKRCCVCGESPQWHHHLMHAGRAVNEAWAIVPLCPKHHKQVNHSHFARLIDWVIFNRATTEELESLSQIMSYKSKRSWLNSIYGEFSPRKIPSYYANIDFNNKTSRR